MRYWFIFLRGVVLLLVAIVYPLILPHTIWGVFVA